MLQFYISEAFANDMSTHLFDGVEPIVEQHTRAMQWYAHRITIKRRKCIVVMELQSRYAMIFCGLTKPDFNNFPALFRKRILCEVASICQLDKDAQAKLTPLVLAQAQQQLYQKGSDSSVQTDIDEVIECLHEWIAGQGRLPVDDSECFDAGIFINQLKREHGNETAAFEPLEQFRRFWSTLSGLMHLAEGRRKAVQQRAIPDNILPFNRSG
ncbi:MAG: hypothetical protein JKX83_12525 [Pseudomonadales bacterium]|nr:hypothetical protein [Pseudomonadales bacterium]